MRRTTIALTMPLAGLVLALGACAGSPDGAAKPTADARPTAESPEKTKDTTSPPPVEPVEGPAGANAACLLGTWLVDPESVKEMTMASAQLSSQDLEFDATVTVTGDAFITFAADGSVVTEYVAQVVDMRAAVGGTEFTSYGSTDGSLVGSYTATETEVTTFDGDASDVRMEVTSSINGEPFDMGDVVGMTVAGWEAGNTLSYVCTQDTLEMRPTLDIGIDMSGFVSRYHRQ